jgi:hypothetical protein
MKRWAFIALKSLPIGFIILSIYVLEYFGRMRMGMMRYLVFMKREFEMGIFQPMVIQGLTVLVVVLTLWVCRQFIKSIEAIKAINSDAAIGKKKSAIWRYWLLNQIILTGWLLIPTFKVLKSYHFALIGWMVLTGLVGIYSILKLRRIDKTSQL